MVAIKTTYPKTWKLGERPIVEELGEAQLPDNWHDLDAELLCRQRFPQATGYAAYDEFGQAAIIAINLL